ncbi:signal peptidase I [Infirmifilum lucidum]|uniref:Signal peptidase I n=1 Tax=Infirmifilum lucidum TaxID=2776706 RepID=A0A7L9FHD7_9CREN|nr:signal peptidase I [Infirmifilum lucidum]QOJ78336.1 signal peptidase I [Infirmifilum lucidum]
MRYLEPVQGEGKERVIRENATLIIALLATVMFIFSLNYLLRTQVPLAVVSSWSMEPTLHVGDIVIVVGSESYSVGDIVVYESPSGLIVHRIVGIVGDAYVTKGDANPFPDSTHPSLTSIKGKVVFVIPYIGAIKLAFESLVRG